MERDKLAELLEHKEKLIAFAKEVTRFNLSTSSSGADAIVSPERLRDLAIRLTHLAESGMPIRTKDLVSSTLTILTGVEQVYSDSAEKYINEVDDQSKKIINSRPSPTSDKEVLTEDEAAKVLGWHKETLAKRRRQTPGQVPKFFRPGGKEGRVYYTRESIIEFIQKSLSLNTRSA